MEQVKRPVITFLLPYRLFTGEREFLGQNIQRRTKDFMGGDENIEMLRGITAYSVMLYQQGYKPLSLEVSIRDMQKYLKPIFPNGKCIGCESMFVQTKSKTMLTVVDFQLFF